MSEVRQLFPELLHPITFPGNHDRQSLHQYLTGFRLDGIESAEQDAYLNEDLNRFVYTLNLLPDGDSNSGSLLEIGANPYYMSALLRKFTDYEAKYSNYFNIDEGEGEQFLDNPESGEHLRFNFTHHNIDACPLPFDEKFDVILFCEVLEHLTIDPMRALLHIKNALQENGYLILSTPNVNRLENVARIISGSNIYDPYSGYGYYGRHNREYNKHELFTLLNHLGFEVEIMFSSDVHDNRCELFFPARKLREILEVEPRRLLDLGQYIFIRARNARPANTLRPDWLFRSYPANEMMQP